MRRLLSVICALVILVGSINLAVFANDAVVATIGDQSYATLDEALLAKDSGVICLQADAGDILVTGDTYLDLNGHNVASITVTDGNLYCSDSSTDDCTVSDGVYGKMGSVIGNVVPAKNYMQVAEDGISFHYVNLEIYAMTLRPEDAGVYYTSYFAGDEVVASKVETYGVALSVEGEPTDGLRNCGYSYFSDFKAGKGANEATSGTLLKNILKESNSDAVNICNADMEVYGRAYLKTTDGYVFGETVTRSLKEQVEAVDEAWSSLQKDQKDAVAEMYGLYTSVMGTWAVPNLREYLVNPEQPMDKVEITLPIVVNVANGVVAEQTTVTENGVTVTVPAGVVMAEGAESLTLSVTPKASSDSGLTLEENQVLMPVDVHIDGISKENTVPVTVSLGKVMPENLNLGNYKTYHVENGKANEMVLIANDAPFTAHNQYKYTLDGELTLYMATFSEVAVVSNAENYWQGGVNTSWYDPSKTTFEIRNADQLAGFNKIVSGDLTEIAKDNFAGDTVNLAGDINIGGENNPNHIWYPIGYWKQGTGNNAAGESDWYLEGGAFCGTFDGKGHKISGVFQNTWLMNGNYSNGYWNAAMGLFGRVENAKIRNLTLTDFFAEGEFTDMGCVTAYASGECTFENISLFDNMMATYNCGTAGIVGWDFSEHDNLSDASSFVFNNITIDNSNTFQALWGTWDCAAGGIMGWLEAPSKVNMTNCHVAAKLDVFNDVCGNYQYYWYRYCGMLIGTVCKTDATNSSALDTNNITLDGCTIHFGDWNDYYYCELVANSLASYTHDHQFSRLTEVQSVDVANKTYVDLKGVTHKVPNEGWCHLVVEIDGGKSDTKAQCYHFNNGVQHNHEDAGYETTDVDKDGVIDNGLLKEDRQHYYIPFNQIFGGQGWGVRGESYEGYEGVKILDYATPAGEVKFDSLYTNGAEIEASKEYTLGQLFAHHSGAQAIKTDAVYVTAVSVATGEDVAIYTPNTDDWTKGTIRFVDMEQNAEKVAIKLTIQDYQLCIPTVVELTLKPRQPEQKFDTKFVNHETYLYRVGNKQGSTVSLNSLFKPYAELPEDNAILSGSVNVSFETKVGNASGSYTANSADWTQGKIQFSGNGVVKLTITDNDYCIPFELLLEVVDAENTTTAKSASTDNIVLLNNTSGSFSVNNGKTFFGNGFTVTLPNSTQSKYSSGVVGIVNIDGGNLDNVQILGPVYPEGYIYREQAKDSTDATKANYFYNSVMVNSGDCNISNCYISGGRAAICVKGGNNIVLENTTVFGGAVANIDLRSGISLKMVDVTTVQKMTPNTCGVTSNGQPKEVMGMGVLVSNSVVTVTIEGALHQYNWASEAEWDAMVPATYASAFPDIFGSGYSAYQSNYNNTKYVNLGFIYMCDWDTRKMVDNRTDKTLTYTAKQATLGGVNGGVYSISGATLTDALYNQPQYMSDVYNPIAPVFMFDNTVNNDPDDENDIKDTYCEYKDGVLSIGLIKDSLTLDLSGISIKKNGTPVEFTAKLNGTTINDMTSVTISGSGVNQVLAFYWTDTEGGFNPDGSQDGNEKAYVWMLPVEVAKLGFPAPMWTMENTTKNGTNCIYVYYTTSQGYAEAVPLFEGITATYYDANGNVQNLDLSGTNAIPAEAGTARTTPFTYTINGCIIKMEYVSGWKSGATTMDFTTYKNKTYIYPQLPNNDNYVRSKVANQDFDVRIKYTITDPNGQSSEPVTVQWYNAAASNNNITTEQWKNFDSTDGKKPSVCFAAGSLVTMADGSQKKIEDVKVGEELLVWDFFKGEYATSPAIINYLHGDGMQEIVNLHYSNGTISRMAFMHGFYDLDAQEFVYLTAENANDYIGHRFATDDGETVTLEDVTITLETTDVYTVVSAIYYNCFVDGVLTNTPPYYSAGFVDNFFDYGFEIGSDMKYDEEQLQSDIEQYGVYTYEDFAGILTYEEFTLMNIQYFKIPVAKGQLSYEDLMGILQEHVIDMRGK